MAANGAIRIPASRRLRFFAQRQLPFLVWIAAAVAAWWLIDSKSERVDAVGIAGSHGASVAPLTAGTVAAVTVDLFENVGAGDITASMDEAPLVAELAVVQAEAQRLRATLEAEVARLEADAQGRERDRIGEARRFAWNLESIELTILDRELQREVDRVELQRIEVSLERVRALVEQGSGQRSQLDDLTLARDAVRKRVDNATRAIEAEEKRRAAARERIAALGNVAESADVRRLVEPHRRAIDVQEARLEALAVQRKALVLRAPIDGVVSKIHLRGGETAGAGQAILAITANGSGRVVAYLTQHDGRIHAAAVGGAVVLRRDAVPGEPLEGTILRAGAAVEEVPAQARRDPNVLEWGRPLLIEVRDKQLVPGETVRVRIVEPGEAEQPH